MVDVGDKPRTERVAVATARLRMLPATRERILAGKVEKGDVLAAARLAGIMAAKRTPDFVPLCHPIALAGVEVTLTPEAAGLSVRARVKTVDRTGVEMEALTAACAAALTVYDMCKSVDRGMVLEAVQLEHKAGGRSGTWHRDAEGAGEAPAMEEGDGPRSAGAAGPREASGSQVGGGKRRGGASGPREASAKETRGGKRGGGVDGTRDAPVGAKRGADRGATLAAPVGAARGAKRGPDGGASRETLVGVARVAKRGADRVASRETPVDAARGGKHVKPPGEAEGLRVALATVVRSGKRAKRGG